MQHLWPATFDCTHLLSIPSNSEIQTSHTWLWLTNQHLSPPAGKQHSAWILAAIIEWMHDPSIQSSTHCPWAWSAMNSDHHRRGLSPPPPPPMRMTLESWILSFSFLYSMLPVSDHIKIRARPHASFHVTNRNLNSRCVHSMRFSYWAISPEPMWFLHHYKIT